VDDEEVVGPLVDGTPPRMSEVMAPIRAGVSRPIARSFTSIAGP
jgi:hypothetical protein